MKHFYTICLTTIAAAYIMAPAQAHELVLDVVDLGKFFTDVNLDAENNWGTKLQYEGFGIAQALVNELKRKYPNAFTKGAENYNVKPILFVGGYGGNSLGGWVAAVVLSTLGFQCELYVIEEETSSKKTAAFMYCESLLNDIRAKKIQGKMPKLTVIDLKTRNEQIKEIEKKLESKKLEEVTEATAMIKNGIREVDVSKYSLVLDGINGAGFAGPLFKIGTVWALPILKAAETTNGNILVSTDFPSLWVDGKPMLSEGYKNFIQDVHTPAVIIHIGAIKPYALDSTVSNIKHYVVIPQPLEEKLLAVTDPRFVKITDQIGYENIVVILDKEKCKEIAKEGPPQVDFYTEYNVQLTV